MGRQLFDIVTSDNTTLLRHLGLEDRLLLACAQPEFPSAHSEYVRSLCERGSIDWSRIYAASESHNVAPLVFENLKLAGIVPTIPASLRLLFEESTGRAKIWKTLQSARLTRVLRYFADLGIDVMLIKGAALDLQIYRQRWHTMSDTDLVLRCRKTDVTDREVARINAFLGALDLKRPLLEVDLFSHHDVTMAGVLPIDFERIWADARTISVDGSPAFVMSPEDSLITSCINSCRKRYFRLKSLSDIAGIVSRFHNLDWDTVIERCRNSECSAICYTALLIAQETLGYRLPQGMLGKLGLSCWKSAVIGHLVSRLSYSSLSSVSAGIPLFKRRLGLSLLLPYASYTWRQFGRNVVRVYHDNRDT
jgi:hypothetical protein